MAYKELNHKITKNDNGKNLNKFQSQIDIVKKNVTGIRRNLTDSRIRHHFSKIKWQSLELSSRNNIEEKC